MFLKAAGLGAAAWLVRRSAHAQEAGRPNIIFILADDLGWMDTQVYGSRYYQTPHINRLAARGMRFTDAYAANPLCSPTRASIMTGKYPCRFGLTTPAGHLPPLPDEPLMKDAAAPWAKVVTPRSRRFLPVEEYTLGEAFRDAGYATGFIGKWHLGVPARYWPEAQGFQFSFHGAPDPGPPSYFSPYRFRAGTVTDGPKGEYITDRVTDEALGYIDRHKDQPFFLCFWHYAVHAPFQAKEELIEHYRGKTDPRGEQDCPTMGGMIHSLDQSIGRLLEHLDRTGLAEKTILVFFSDNGGNMYNTVDGTTPTNNAPLRSGKGNIHEGGVREPCIVAWPGTVKPGSTSSEVITSIDFYPTLLEMAGIKAKGGKLLDGQSIVPLLTGTGEMRREAICCHFPHYIPATDNLPSTSVRQGPWKLIRVYGEGPDQRPAFELYNLDEDIGETTNLADKMPERVKAMDALIGQHLKATDALVPFPNPNYNPKARHPRAVKPVAGWRPSGHCNLSVKDGILRVDSFGGDPFLHTSDVPRVTGPLKLTIRIKLKTRGPGQAFWNTVRAGRFHRSRRVTFPLTHDGAWHDVAVDLPVKHRLTALRIDPGTAPGLVEIDWMRLARPDGTAVKTWEF
jgi:arylsulfatase A-like enzyme